MLIVSWLVMYLLISLLVFNYLHYDCENSAAFSAAVCWWIWPIVVIALGLFGALALFMIIFDKIKGTSFQ